MTKFVVNCNLKTSKIFEQIKEATAKSGLFVDVGINAQDGSKEYEAKGGTGATATVAEVATYQEFGWVQQVTGKQSRFLHSAFGVRAKKGGTLMMPPRPFLRGTLQSESKNWVEAFGNAIGRRGVENLTDSLLEVGMLAQNDIQNTIANGGTEQEKFPRRSAMTMAIYEALSRDHRTDGTGGISGDKPLFRSGVLLNSISYQLRG